MSVRRERNTLLSSSPLSLASGCLLVVGVGLGNVCEIGTITSLLMDDLDPNPWVFQTKNTILRSGQVSATGLPIPVGHNLWATGHSQVFRPVFIFSCHINIIN